MNGMCLAAITSPKAGVQSSITSQGIIRANSPLANVGHAYRRAKDVRVMNDVKVSEGVYAR
jgi:hypothetical protein